MDNKAHLTWGSGFSQWLMTNNTYKLIYKLNKQTDYQVGIYVILWHMCVHI